MPWPFKIRRMTMTDEERAHHVRISQMRVALYGILWNEIQKKAKFPMPIPDTSLTEDVIREELKEIILGD